MPAKKLYAVKVVETRRFWCHVEVEAETQAEAEELALDDYTVEWDDSAEENCEVTILAENAVPVEWSQEAYELDPENPYRPKMVTTDRIKKTHDAIAKATTVGLHSSESTPEEQEEDHEISR